MESNPENLKKGDYVELVVNFLGDSAGSIPVAGAFISAVKNVGMNIYTKKQQERILIFLIDLHSKVMNIESLFELNKNDDVLMEHFFKTLYRSREILNENEYNVRLNYIKRLFNKEILDDDRVSLFSVIENLSPLAYKLLKELYDKNNCEWIDLHNYFFNEPNGENAKTMGINYGSINPFIHAALLDMVKLYILQEEHHTFMGLNSQGYLEKIKISQLGFKIIELINS